MKIFRQLKINPSDLRGIGIQISQLTKGVNKKGALDMFLTKTTTPEKKMQEEICKQSKAKQILPEEAANAQSIPENDGKVNNISEQQVKKDILKEDVLHIPKNHSSELIEKVSKVYIQC